MKKVSFVSDGKRRFTKQEIEKKRKEVEMSVEFLKLIEQIDITADKYKVILTLGDNELVYDDGEFYISETLNETKRRKIARKYAQQIYVDYYMRYHLNSSIQKDIQERVKEKGAKTKTKKKTQPTKSAERKVIEPKGIAKEILKEKEKGPEKKAKTIEEEMELM